MGLTCPHCGGEVTTRDIYFGSSFVFTQVLSLLLENQGKWVPCQKIASRAYASHPRGGPRNYQNCLAATISRSKQDLAAGWKVEGKPWHGYRITRNEHVA